MRNKLKAVIIGAGKIGASFDNPDSKDVLTHAHAYKKHRGFEIAGFVDSNFKKAKRASKIWGGIPAKKILELSRKTKIDVVSVCVPDEKHYKILKEIEKLKISGGIIEKPLTCSLKDSKKIIESEFFKKRKFLVNYIRRFVPEFRELRERILGGKYGKFITGSGIYGKGLLHSGSHAIDLLRYLLGEIKDKKILSAIYDFSEEDPTCSLMLGLNNGGRVLVNTMDSRYFTVFELDLYFEKARIRIIDSGFQIQEYILNKDKIFKGYKKVYLKKIIRTSLNQALYCAVDDLYGAIIYDRQPVCAIKDGYEAQKICTI